MELDLGIERGFAMGKNRFFAAIVTIGMLVAVLFTGCSAMDPDMKISVDGHEFSLDCTVQEILDAGFDISEIDHESKIISKDNLPVIGSMIMDTTNYYLISNGIACNVAFNVYNNSSSDLALNECKVYQFKYDAGTYEEYATKDIETPEVLLNGISCKFTDCGDTANTLIDAGFKFKSSDVEAFDTDDMYSTSVISATGLGGHTLMLYHDYDYTESVVRMNGFDISIKLDYEIK